MAPFTALLTCLLSTYLKYFLSLSFSLSLMPSVCLLKIMWLSSVRCVFPCCPPGLCFQQMPVADAGIRMRWCPPPPPPQCYSLSITSCSSAGEAYLFVYLPALSLHPGHCLHYPSSSAAVLWSSSSSYQKVTHLSLSHAALAGVMQQGAGLARHACISALFT